MSNGPITMFVTVEVKPERVDEFLEVMNIDTEGSRKEPGCMRFDLLRSSDKDNVFHFYEAYKDADAIAFHKEQPHYQKWADFKASGGIVDGSQTVAKATGANFQE